MNHDAIVLEVAIFALLLVILLFSGILVLALRTRNLPDCAHCGGHTSARRIPVAHSVINSVRRYKVPLAFNSAA